MKNAKLNWVRLPLDGIENCRELGGYGTKEGEQIKWHTFLRSSDMGNATEEDILFLKEYGVATIIDLRGADEAETLRNPLAEENFCEYYNIPLFIQPLTDLTLPQDLDMGEFYISLLEKTTTLKKIFETINQAKPGTILFHCMAGKDRTGVLAMLLLGLAGVEKKDIVSNYEVTYSNLESFHKHDILPEGIPIEFLFSKREYIAHAYDYIIQNYESIENYLRTKNIDQEVIDGVKERLLQGDTNRKEATIGTSGDRP